jgi:hypothetical protein
VVIRPHDEASEQIILSSKSTASTVWVLTFRALLLRSVLLLGTDNCLI